MRFYNRSKEMEFLRGIEENSLDNAQMTILVGRRRIGKTSLIKKSFEGKLMVYLFIARKSEALLSEEFVREVELILGVTIHGEIKTFKTLFAYLMELSLSRSFTLVIDEFQEFYNINTSVFSDIQNIWDSHKDHSKMNLILCGSIYSLMKKIFENSKEPLFARFTEKITVRPFDLVTMKEILAEHYPKYTHEDLLAFYLFTGGVAKYVEIFVRKRAFTKAKMLNEVFREESFFMDEGKNVLIEEFGKEYGIYFSILSLIASSRTSRSEIESVLGTTVGGYLERLENDFNLIKKVRPIFAKQGTKTMKYKIEDNFLNFWFRFIYKYSSAIEIGNYEYVKDIVERDYNMYSGLVLEKYFTTHLIETKQFSEIGSYWEKGNKNEIDIVALNDLEKKLLFVEVKRNKEKINLEKLKEKSLNIVKNFPDYLVQYKGLSIEDLDSVNSNS